MPNFIAPNETFKLPVVNSDEKILFSKDFVKRNLNLNKYNDLILMNITEDNMQGTINIGDLALIIKFQNKEKPILNNGIFAINLNGRLCIRRLQFLKLKQRTLVHIISDNKKYRDDAVAIDELEIYGEVVWKSNSFKDIDFIKHESEEPNLFLPDNDYEIPSFLNNNKKETA
jgi:phage repressor protein C with HTH and peptisase S24 domain